MGLAGCGIDVRRAIGLNPSLSNSYRFLAEVLSVTGRHAEAVAAIEKGRQLDPLSPISVFKPALIHYLNRDFERAAEIAAQGLVTIPGFWQGHWLLCLSAVAMNELGTALPACEQGAELSRRTPMALGALGYAHAMAGNTAAAESVLEELNDLADKTYVGPSFGAIILAAMDDLDSAFEAMEMAVAVRDINLIHIDNLQYFDSLRQDSRYPALRAQIHEIR